MGIALNMIDFRALVFVEEVFFLEKQMGERLC